MRLYHGTPLSASEKIESDGKISHDIERTHYADTGMPTTDGFVYLTDNAGYATYLAQRIATVVTDEDFCVVYAIDIDESELQADIDQLRYIAKMSESDALEISSLNSLKLVQSCRVPRSLLLGKDVKGKIIFPSGTNNKHSDYPLMTQLRSLRKPGDAEQAAELIATTAWISI